MKTYSPLLIFSITALAAIAPNLFVGLTGNICGADAKALGVSDTDTANGEQVPVVTHGIALVKSGAAFPAGADISSDVSGKAVTAVTGKINGYALDESTSSNQLVRILLV